MAERAIVPVVATHQTGDCVVAILSHPEQTKGKPVTFEVEVLSQTELLKTWGEVLGVKTAYKEVTPEEYEQSIATGTFPILGPNAPIIAKFLTELFQLWLYMADGKGRILPNLVQARDILPADYQLETWREFVANADWSSVL
jgi:hypothetical protein